MEVILTLREIGESGMTAHTSASLLQRIAAQFKSTLREIKQQISQRRREPAGNFSGRAEHAAMAGQVHQKLTNELLMMRRPWMDIQEVIARWKAAAEGPAAESEVSILRWGETTVAEKAESE